jgi:hypothetical protein
MNRSIVALGLLAGTLAVLLPARLPEAHAQAAACVLRGTPIMPRTGEIFGAAAGGDPIARFTGQPVASSVTLPTANGRAAIRTGSGQGGVRIEGFLELAAVPAQSTRDLPILADHVWIAGGKAVKLVGLASGQVTVELTLGAPLDQTVRATTGCDGLSLDPQAARPAPIPGNARGYLVKKSPLELRPAPGAASAFTLTSPDIKDALLFWSTERKGGQVHVHLSSDLVVDAWVAAGDLAALKEGEMMDALATGTTSISTPKIAMQGEPRIVKVTKEVPIRGNATDLASPIGAIESGAEVLVLETVLGWSNIVPAALNLMPPDGRGFWVKTVDLGITPPGPPAK